MSTIAGHADSLTDAHRATIKVAEEVMATLGRADLEGFMAYFDEDGALEFPFHTPDEPPRIAGKSTIQEYLISTGGYKFPRAFPISAVYPGHDPEWVVIEFRGDFTDTRTDEDYSNRYIAVLRVKNGKIMLFREFFDSLTREKYEG